MVAVLARLLAPSDFGTVAAALVFIGFSLIFSLTGVGPALVQRERLGDSDVATALLVTGVMGTVSTVAAVWLSPVVAGWFRIESLDLVIRGIAPVFLVQALAVVPESLMRRELRYREISLIQITAYAIGYALVGVWLAFLDFGAWALVFAHLVQNVVRLSGVLLIQPITVRGAPSANAARTLIAFGSGLVLAQVGNYVASFADKAIAGRWLGAHSLGLYSNAFQLMLMPATFIGQVFDDLLFPLMSRVSKDPARLTRAYRAALTASYLVILPISGVMFELAPEIVAVVLGPQWASAVVPLKILVLGMLFRSSSRIADALVRASGAVYRGAVRHWLYAVLVTVGALIGQNWGVSGLATGVCLALLGNFVFAMKLSAHLTDLKLLDLVGILVRPVVLGVSTWLTVFGVAAVLREQAVHPIGVVCLSSGTVFCALTALILVRPGACLGSDGLWILSTLAEQLPKRMHFLRRRLTGVR